MVTAVSDGSGHYRTTLGEGEGTFRGVPFLIMDEVSQRGGQRVARREFPQRSDGGADSLGTKMRERTFQCVVLGGDYMAQRDALMTALDAPGQGELVHPYWGTLPVVIESWDSRESLSAQGRCDFTISCLPPLSTTAPQASDDTEQQVADAADNVTAAAEENFTNSWSLDGLSLSDMDTVIKGVTDTLADIEGAVNSMLSWVDDVQHTLGLIDAMKANAEHLINAPAQLASALSSSLGSIRTICSVSDSLATYRHMSARMGLTGNGVVMTSSRYQRHLQTNLWRTKRGLSPQVRVLPVSAQQALANLESLDFFMAQCILTCLTQSFSDSLTQAVQVAQQRARQSGLSKVYDATMPATWVLESRAQAQDGVSVLASAWDDVMLQASTLRWSGLSREARTMRLLILADTRERILLLPKSDRVTTTLMEPALLTMHRYAGDCRGWQTMARRNDVINPLFVPGGADVEVLSHG
ncbi:DNA circularization protein [Aeromonas piscicola]|uniref:DNA circularization protein n=1 Tax=Aeromonas piscicola TaxID=600645 RepID=UPI0005B50B4D|nr:DNA circularization N-terminal domain-containing protein [Aeromonas piscicola]